MKKKGKLAQKLKKNKLVRGVANIALGVLNGNPVTAPWMPSAQNFNETIDNADLNQDGKIGNTKKGELIVYYILNNMGVILGAIGFILLILGVAGKEKIIEALEVFEHFNN